MEGTDRRADGREATVGQQVAAIVGLTLLFALLLFLASATGVLHRNLPF